MDFDNFGSLVGPHTDAMARVAAALVGVADAEDAAQEALMRAWRAWPTLREAGAARAWLLRITTNVCRNWQTGRFGTHRRTNQSLDAAAQTLLLRAGVPGPGNGDHADALDLQRAIASLSDDLGQVVALRFYAGMDASEIGELLDTPPATIRTRLRRALMLLRDALGPTSGPAPGPGADTTAYDHSVQSSQSARSLLGRLERGM
jgi:RNA polymerase sigma-70 factor, ECF subfamily